MAFLKLTNNDIPAIIDDSDYLIAMLHSDNWRFSNGVCCNSKILLDNKGRRKIVYLHRLLLGKVDDNGLDVDHINSNPFDNRRSNLRWATQAQNNQNRRKLRKTSSKYKNVYWDKATKSWRVTVLLNRKSINGGRFLDEIEAACKADDLMMEYHKEFARLNFPLYGA